MKKHVSIFQEIQANFENSSIPPSRQSRNTGCKTPTGSYYCLKGWYKESC